MLSVQLYTVNSTANTPTAIDAVLALLDFTGSVDVSRTIGPANWYTLNKQMLAGTESVSFPREDIEGRPFTSARGIAKLRRKESVLTVSFHQALRNDVPPQAAGFYISCVRLSFGPSDIFIPTEDKEGQEDVELIDLAQFIFSISCDRFGGRLDAFKEALQVVPQFIQFRSELEQVTGPLTLHFSR
jgi:hypothetical protein